MKNHLLILTFCLSWCATGLRGEDPFGNIIKSLSGGVDYDTGKDEKKFEDYMLANGYFNTTKVDGDKNNLLHRIVTACYDQEKLNKINNQIVNNLKIYATWIIQRGGQNLLEQKNNDKKTPLTLAIECSPEMTKVILDEMEKKETLKKNETKLVFNALNYFNFEKVITQEVVGDLLGRDINWEYKDDIDNTVLHYSSRNKGLTKFLTTFVTTKNDIAKKFINAQAVDSSTPLTSAATGDQVTALLGVEGINVNMGTPLGFFIRDGKVDCVKALLQSNKVDVKTKMKIDGKEVCPITYAEQNLKEFPGLDEVIKIMEDRGARECLGELKPEPKPAPEPLSPADQALENFAAQLAGLFAEKK